MLLKLNELSSYRTDYEQLEIELGHVPSYDEENESEIGSIEIKDK